jgi:hypothetical protein
MRKNLVLLLMAFTYVLVSESSAQPAIAERYLFPFVLKMNTTPILVKPDETISLVFKLINNTEIEISYEFVPPMVTIQAFSNVEGVFDNETPDLSASDKNVISGWPSFENSRLVLIGGTFPAFSSGRFPTQTLNFRFSKRGSYQVRVLIELHLNNGTQMPSNVVIASKWVPVLVNR